MLFLISLSIDFQSTFKSTETLVVLFFSPKQNLSHFLSGVVFCWNRGLTHCFMFFMFHVFDASLWFWPTWSVLMPWDAPRCTCELLQCITRRHITTSCHLLVHDDALWGNYFKLMIQSIILCLSACDCVCVFYSVLDCSKPTLHTLLMMWLRVLPPAPFPSRGSVTIFELL